MSLFEELLGKHHGRARHGHHHDDRHDHRPNFGSQNWGGDSRHGSRHDWGDSRHGDQHGWGGEHFRTGSSHAAPLLALAMRNKNVIVALAVLAVVLLVAAVAVLAWLLPFLAQSLGFVGENGIKGVLERFAPILNLLWNGSGK